MCVDELFILKEVIRNKESLFHCDVNISLCDSVEYAISQSDQTWIVSDGILSNKKLDTIKNSAFQNNKIVFEFQDPWVNLDEKSFDKSWYQHEHKKMNVLPRIMIIAFGKWTQLYSVELFFAKILMEKGANVFQQFSNRTQNFLNQLDEKGFLNPKLASKKRIEESDVVLQCYESCALDYSREGWNEALSIFQSKVDIVYLLFDRSFMDYDNINEIKKRFIYKCGIVPNGIVLSNFRDLNISESQCKYMISVKDRKENRQDIINLNNYEMLNCLEDSIKKITTPRGISLVSTL